jgi:CheY-like chemotaxis protein
MGQDYLRFGCPLFTLVPEKNMIERTSGIHNGEQKTVLVVDDEKVILDISRAMLEKEGYRVLEAETGAQAIDIAKNFDGKIDLVLLDVVLPDMVGNEIYSLLKAARPNLKVIVCSGHSVDGPIRDILDAGAQNFIQKPFSITVLSEKLKDALKD